MAISDILFRISTDTTAFQQSMGKVNGTLDKIDKQARKTTSGFTALGATLTSAGTTMTLGITAPLVALGIGAAKASGDIDVLKRALLATTGSADEASKQFERLQDIAKLPGIGLQEAVRGSIRLQNYGLSASLSEKALRNFSNAVAAGGGSADDTSEALRQLGQMYGRGKVTMDNLGIILERVPQAAAIIRKEWGSEALADPAKAFEKLGLTSQQVIETLIDRMDAVPRVSVGFTTSMENLGQAIKIAAGTIGDELTPYIIAAIPKIEEMAAGTKDAIRVFKDLPEPIKKTALAITAIAIAAGPVALVIGKLAGAFTAIKTFAIGAATLLQPVATGITLIGTAAVAAGLAVGSFIYWLKQTPTALAQQKKAADEAAEGMRKINERMGTGAQSAKELPVPFGLAAEGIIAFGKALENKAPKLKELTEQQKKAAEEARKAAAEAYKNSFAGLAEAESTAKIGSALKAAASAWLEYNTMHDLGGKKMPVMRSELGWLAEASEKYAAGLRAAGDSLKALIDIQMPTPVGFPELPTRPFGSNSELANESASALGIETESQRAKRIADLQRHADTLRELNRRGDPNVSGNMVIEAEEKLKAAIEGTGRAATTSGKAQTKALQQVSTVVTDLSRGIAGIIFDGGKFGDMLQKVAKQAGQAITRELIEGALSKLSKKLFDVGGLMGKVFGGAGGAGGTIFSAAGSAGGSVASAAGSAAGGIGGAAGGIGGAASAASGSLTAVVGAVGSVVSAISGVIGNFQMAGMNKTLDLIEHQVRFSQIHLLNTLNKANEFWPYMKSVWESLIRMETAGGFGGGGGTVNVSMAGAYLMSDAQMGDFADRLARFLKARGI
jgi:tape measure domain-containing protein